MFGRINWNFWILVLAVGISQPAFADDMAIPLVYQFQPGQFLHYESDDKSEVLVQNAGVADKQGNPFESKSIHHTQVLKSYRVVTVDEEGGAIIEPIAEKVRMTSQAGDNPPANYDSTTGEKPAKEFETVAGTIGRPLARFHFAANGKMLKVSMLAKDVPKSFSEAAEKLNPTINFLVVFPEKPVKIGEKWSEKYDTSVLLNGINQPLKLIRSFELVQVTGSAPESIATIRFRTSLLSPTNEPEVLRQIIDQTPSGTITFHVQQGRILSKTKEINEKVIEAFGPKTLLQARGGSTEKLIVPNSAPRVSSAPNPLPK